MCFAEVAQVTAGAIGAGLVGLGGYVVLLPGTASRGYGLAMPEGESAARGYAAAAGWRDISAGAVMLLVLLMASSEVLGVVALAIALIPLGDITVLARHGVSFGLAYLIHAIGAAALLIIGIILLMT